MKRVGNMGFTLLELLVVVIIVGILASLALPQFGKAMKKARSAEAVATVGAFLTAEWAYYTENPNIGFITSQANISQLLAEAPTGGKFEYTVSGAARNATVTATPKAGAAGVEGITVTGNILSTGARSVTTTIP